MSFGSCSGPSLNSHLQMGIVQHLYLISYKYQVRPTHERGKASLRASPTPAPTVYTSPPPQVSLRPTVYSLV